jgi:hypothetical protein
LTPHNAKVLAFSGKGIQDVLVTGFSNRTTKQSRQNEFVFPDSSYLLESAATFTACGQKVFCVDD